MLNKKFKTNIKDNKGFTLMEMLIVVAIIAILVAIAFPIFNDKLEEARKATNVANIRTSISAATSDYATKNKSGEGKYLYNIALNKLYDANEKDENGSMISQVTTPLPNRSQKTGLFKGVFIIIDPNDNQAPIKTYPYVNKEAELVFEKQGDANWDGPHDAVSPVWAYERAGVNHFDALTN